VYLVDRAKDMIVSGGENVYSVEVEDVLYRHLRCSKRRSSASPTPMGRSRLRSRDPAQGRDRAQLIEHCRARVAAYKVPKQIELRTDPLPKSGAAVLKRGAHRTGPLGSRVGGS
jgi:long-chain acyl-CoA synthetase